MQLCWVHYRVHCRVWGMWKIMSSYRSRSTIELYVINKYCYYVATLWCVIFVLYNIYFQRIYFTILFHIYNTNLLQNWITQFFLPSFLHLMVLLHYSLNFAGMIIFIAMGMYSMARQIGTAKRTPLSLSSIYHQNWKQKNPNSPNMKGQSGLLYR